MKLLNTAVELGFNAAFENPVVKSRSSQWWLLASLHVFYGKVKHTQIKGVKFNLLVHETVSLY